ncbi:MAG: type IX secretion system membrane protein PorP/SprF [Bacteroidota bacterium]
MNKIFFVGSFLVLTTTVAIAQQEYQFSNTMNNPFYLNPAAGGMTDVIQLEAGARMQWTGYDQSPTTFMLSGSSQINFKGKHSEKVIGEFNVKDETFFSGPKNSVAKSKHVIGGKIMSDNIGPFMKTSIAGSYAYHLPLTKSINFGAGIGLGYSNFRVNESRVVLYQQDDAAYMQFLGSTSGQSMLDAQAGLVVYSEKFFVGLSGTQLLKNKVKWNGVMTESNMNRHLFLIAKYRFDIGEVHAIEPGAVLKSTLNSPLSIDFGARYIWKGAVWGGLQYRTNSTLVFQVGANIAKGLYLNYNYDQALGKLAGRGAGTHEIQLGLYLGKNRNVDKELKDNKEAKL